MSRITRRLFLRHCATIAGSTTLAACTWAGPTSTDGFTPSEIVIWSTPNTADTALARWRRIHPDINVRRQIVDTNTLASRLQSLSDSSNETPDVIIADSYTIKANATLQQWRHIDDAPGIQIVPAARADTQINDTQLFGHPLTVNPIKLWYHSTIIDDALGVGDDTQLQSMFGKTWDDYVAFVGKLRRSNPMITTISSCFEDVFYPLYLDGIGQTASIEAITTRSIALVQAQLVGRAVHFTGEWFDLLKRNSIAMVVGGRWMGQALVRGTRDDVPSPWRTITHPLGSLYGPGIVAVIPIQSARYEQATTLVRDFGNDTELQLLISSESGSLPSHLGAYSHVDMQKVDAINPTKTLIDDWHTTQAMRTPPVTPDQIIYLQHAKKIFYAWQSGKIDVGQLFDEVTHVR